MNINEMDKLLKEISEDKLNQELKRQYNKKSYRKKIYPKKESTSIQILNKYIENRVRFNLLGVQKKSIRFTENVKDFMKRNNLIVTGDSIKYKND